MTINFDKIQNDVRVLGSIAENTSFLEGFLSAFNFPKATFGRLSTESLQGVNRGVYVQRKIYFLPTTASNPCSEFHILKKNDRYLRLQRFCKSIYQLLYKCFLNNNTLTYNLSHIR